MDRTLVAVFDSKDEAQEVRQALAGIGIAPERLHVRAATSADLGESADADVVDRRGFFERLFGGPAEDDEYTGRYAEAVRRGCCVVVVDAVDANLVDRAASIMSQHGAVDIDERAASWAAAGWRGYEDDAPDLSEDEVRAERERYASMTGAHPEAQRASAIEGEGVARIPVVEEQLEVGKRVVERGGVRVLTRTAQRPVEENVTLREERARVERRPVDRPATAADLDAAFREGSVEVRETQEQPVVSKTARVVEEVEVGKDVEERTETVRDTVRRTEVEVEDVPASRVGGSRRKGSSKPAGRS